MCREAIQMWLTDVLCLPIDVPSVPTDVVYIYRCAKRPYRCAVPFTTLFASINSHRVALDMHVEKRFSFPVSFLSTTVVVRFEQNFNCKTTWYVVQVLNFNLKNSFNWSWVIRADRQVWHNLQAQRLRKDRVEEMQSGCKVGHRQHGIQEVYKMKTITLG